MKRLITSIFAISVFFIGLGAMIEGVSAKFKSDEKALEIVRAARTAIGGDAALREVKSLVVVGKTINSVNVNGVEKSEAGETEIALQFPDKMMKSIKIGDGNAAGGDKVMTDRHEIVMTGKAEGDKILWERKDGEFTTADGKKFTIKNGDNAEFTTEDGKKVIVRSTEKSSTATVTNDGEAKVFVRKQADGGEWTGKDGEAKVLVRKHDDGGEWKTEGGKDIMLEKVRGGHDGGFKQNELLRTTLGLLLTAPDGMDISYTFVGEGDVDGTAVNIINASFAGANYKLFIGKSNSLPVALSYTGHHMPAIVHFDKKIDAPKDGNKDVMIFKRHDELAGKSAEFTVKFSDFRGAGGVQLPYKWTTTSGGRTVETFDVTSYELNPANIADRFKDQKVMVRMKHPDSK